MKLKHLLREMVVVFFGWSGMVKKYKHTVSKREPLVRILCFHDVLDKNWFDSLVSMLKSEYQVVTPSEFLNNQFHPDKINILMTFDDGYQSWVDNCLPALKSQGLIGLFFVNSGLLDVHGTEQQKDYVKERLMLKPRNTLSWEGARELVLNNQELGGHSVGHLNLAELEEAELSKEISGDLEKIKQETGTTPRLFAYPFGTPAHYTEIVKQVASKSYQGAFIAHPGFYTKATDGYAIPRTCLMEDQSLASVKRWIEGGYDLFYKTKSR